MDGCVEPIWHGDGYCEDYHNHPECNFDGGDCCGEVNTDYCDDCECLDPDYVPAPPPCENIWSNRKCRRNRKKCQKNAEVDENCQKRCGFCS